LGRFPPPPFFFRHSPSRAVPASPSSAGIFAVPLFFGDFFSPRKVILFLPGWAMFSLFFRGGGLAVLANFFSRGFFFAQGVGPSDLAVSFFPGVSEVCAFHPFPFPTSVHGEINLSGLFFRPAGATPGFFFFAWWWAPALAMAADALFFQLPLSWAKATFTTRPCPPSPGCRLPSTSSQAPSRRGASAWDSSVRFFVLISCRGPPGCLLNSSPMS